MSGEKPYFTLYGLRFGWAIGFANGVADFLSNGPPLRGDVVIGIHFTTVFVALLIAATLIGWLCALVYGRARRGEGGGSSP